MTEGSSKKKNRITFLGILGIGLTTVIGSGIWRDGLTWPHYAGITAIIAILISWLLMMTAGLAFAECVSMFPKSGGPYSYVGGAINKTWGRIVGTLYIVGYFFITVILGFLTALFTYIALGIQQDIWLTVLTVVYIVIFGVLAGISPPRTLGHVSFVWASIKILLLVIVGTLALINGNTANFTAGTLTWDGFQTAIYSSIFALLGFEVILIFAGEIEKNDEGIKSKRKLPFGIIFSLIIILFVYIYFTLGGASLVQIGALDNPNDTVAVLAFLSEQTGIPLRIISLFAAISASGTLYSLQAVSIHQLRVMARDESLPKLFAKTKNNIYYANVVVITTITAAMGGLMMGLLPIYGGPIIDFYGFIGIGLVLLSSMIPAGIIALYLRIKMPILDRPFKTPMYYIIFPLSILLGIFLFVLNLLSFLA